MTTARIDARFQALKAEGRADQMGGKVQNAVGGVKDTLRDDRT